jgi:hypothetical protein
MLDKDMSIEDLLSFYMGKNTPTRQEFIIDNLKVDDEVIEPEDILLLDETHEAPTEIEEEAVV